MMILTRNFFNVVRTAMEKSFWKGSEAKNVYLALQELDRLHEHNSQQGANHELQKEYKPEAGDIEYVEEKEEDLDETIPDIIEPNEDEKEQRKKV